MKSFEFYFEWIREVSPTLSASSMGTPADLGVWPPMYSPAEQRVSVEGYADESAAIFRLAAG